MEQDHLAALIATDVNLRNSEQAKKEERMQQAVFDAIDMLAIEKEIWRQSGMEQLIGKSTVGTVDLDQLNRLSQYLEHFAQTNPGLRLDVVMYVHQLCSRLIMENDQLRTKLRDVCGLWVKETMKAQRFMSPTSIELGRRAS